MKKLLFFLALLFLSVPGWGANYYVRTDGHDTASGVNDTNNATTGAFRTIGKGATVASAGDMVIINDGTYAEGLVTFSRSGSAGNMIYFRAANNRQAQLIGGIKITGNFVKVEGLKIAYTAGISTSPAWASGNNNEIRYNWVENARGTGILASGAHNILANNYITKPQFGIGLSGDHNVAMNNEVSGLTNWGQGDDDDYSRFVGTNHSFINNYFHGADPEALSAELGAHVDCFQTFDAPDGAGTSHDILIDGNRCDAAHQGVMVSAVNNHDSSRFTIRNNVFSNMRSWMICDFGVTDVYIYNNTFYVSVFNGVGAIGNGTIIVKNNIFYNAGDYFVNTGGSIISSGKNLLYKTVGSFTQGDYPNDIVNLNPNFVSSSDYRLQAGSPAIDKGSTISGFSSDILGISRPQGAAWDIGAYELIKIPPVIPLTPKAPENIRVN